MLLSEPPPTNADLRFQLFGIPVRVHPFFWLGAVLLGWNSPGAIAIVMWVLAVFVAILIHEFGHAGAMRAYGYYPYITLQTFGGSANYGYESSVRRTPNLLGRLIITASGPGAGFLAVALATLILWLSGRLHGIALIFGFIPLPMPVFFNSMPLNYLLGDFLFICILWGVINLLPVFPLDGGHIVRDLFIYFSPRDGLRQSLMLSLTVAVIVTVFAVSQQGYFAAILFGSMAYENWVMLRSYGGGSPW